MNAPSAGAHADDGRKPDATGTAPKDHGRAAATVGTLTMKDGLLVGMFSADDESRMPDIPSLIMGDDVTF